MAQASSAQREPSMEEILSSIRRIIEDSDSGATDAQASDEPKLTEAAGKSEPAKIDSPAGGQAAVSKALAPKSLADIQQEIATGQEVSPATESGKEVKPETKDIVDKGATGTSSDGGQENSAPKAEKESPKIEEGPAEIGVGAKSAQVEIVAGNKSAEKDSGEEAAWAEALKDEEPKAEKSSPARAVKLEAASKPSENSPILSPDAGRRVAASFEQLSEAFMESRTQAFDSMAENMLRPMLQEWLDENLPTLVERLVREEIERVARGGN